MLEAQLPAILFQAMHGPEIPLPAILSQAMHGPEIQSIIRDNTAGGVMAGSTVIWTSAKNSSF